MNYDIIKILSINSNEITDEEFELIKELPFPYKDLILTEHLYEISNIEKKRGLERLKSLMDEKECSYLRIEII